MNLPTFEMVIDTNETSDVEVSFVALVDKPAIERNFMMFKDKSLAFALNEEKRIISGPAMVADSPIYRRDESGEYNVFFSAETIRDIAIKFFKKDYQKNLNLFHDPSLSLEGVTIFESFVSDVSRGISPMKGFEDLPDGSWFISAKVDNEEVWNRIKSGEVKGFSVEGIFSYIKKGSKLNATTFMESLFTKSEVMSVVKDLITELKAKFIGEPNQVLSDYQLEDGTAVSITELAVGGVVTIEGMPAPAGDHKLADGTVLTVGDGGVISAVSGMAPEVPETPMSQDYAPKFAAYDEKFTAYEQKFEEQGSMLNKLSESFNKTNETIVHLVGIIEKMAAEPTADPVGQTPNNFQTQKAKSKEDARKDLVERFSKIKNK